VFVNVMSVFECCMNINFATFSGTTYRILPSPQHLRSNSPAKIQDTCQDRYQNWHMKLSKHSKISWVMSQLWHFPRADQACILVTKAFTPTLTLPGGLCATLVQKGAKEETQIILHTSRRINSRRIKKITHPFYLRQQLHEFM